VTQGIDYRRESCDPWIRQREEFKCEEGRDELEMAWNVPARSDDKAKVLTKAEGSGAKSISNPGHSGHRVTTNAVV
jgi:hypothetical protein